MDSFPIIRVLYNGLYSGTKKGTYDSTHEIITKLKFIGMVKKGEKIDVKALKVHSSSKWYAFWRMWCDESRDTTLEFLTTTINRAFEILQLNLSRIESNKTLCRNLIADLITSTMGMINLQSTYSDDRIFLCQIQTLIQSIEVKLKDIRSEHQDLFPKGDIDVSLSPIEDPLDTIKINM